jgi:ABC-2 type transport system ATP-binding protein
VESSVTLKDLSVTLGGRVKALQNVTVAFPTGKTIGVIGPSGAGKTTLIRCIVGRQRTNAGEIRVFNLPAGSPALRRQLTYMTQELSVYSDLTVYENLKYFAVMSGQPKKHIKSLVNDLLKQVDLTDKAGVLVSNLSGGQKQRASLAVALIGSPKLMVLDEPTVGLDPVLREKLWDLFARLAKQGITLIISSHSMDEANRCDDLVLIRDGILIAHDSPGQLRSQTGTKSIEDAFLKLVGNQG